MKEWSTLKKLIWLKRTALSGPALPDGYEKLKYVTFDGATYVQTGASIDQNCVAKVKFRPTAIDSNHCVYRYTITGNAESFACYFTSQGYTRTYVTTQTVYETLAENIWHTVENGKSGASFDGSFKAYGDVSDFTCPYPLRIGTQVSSNGGIGTGKYAGDMAFFKITKNGVAVIDYVPAKRTADNVVGFYDLANDMFIEPESGTLTGPT